MANVAFACDKSYIVEYSCEGLDLLWKARERVLITLQLITMHHTVDNSQVDSACSMEDPQLLNYGRLGIIRMTGKKLSFERGPNVEILHLQTPMIQRNRRVPWVSWMRYRPCNLFARVAALDWADESVPLRGLY
jgi:hypothetical protein